MRQELVVVVPRQAQEPIGLNITGGRELEAGAIFVHSTRDNGPCAGLLFDHDVIVSINGNVLSETAKRSDAVEIVEGSSGDLTFVVMREPHSGMLIKQGFKNKNWKKRLFVVHDTALSYYNPNTSKETGFGRDITQQGTPLGTIQLENVTAIEDFALSSKKDLYGFQLVTPSRTYYLFAETPKEKKQWIDVVQPLIGQKGEVAPAGAIVTAGPVTETPKEKKQWIDVVQPLIGQKGEVAPGGAIDTAGPVTESDDDDNEAVAAFEDADDADDAGTTNGEGELDTPGVAAAQKETVTARIDSPATQVGYTGFMLKSSPDFKSWKRRFFVLKDLALKYYKVADTKGKPQGEIVLGPGCSIEAYEGPLTKGNPHAFKLTVREGREYICSCSNDSERDTWVGEIQRELATVGE